MEKRSGWAHHVRFGGLVVACLAVFAFSDVAAAGQAILKVTPATIIAPGNVLKFQADILGEQGDASGKCKYFVDCTIEQDLCGTSYFPDKPCISWNSDERVIVYPGMLGSVHLNFIKGFQIPPNTLDGAHIKCRLMACWIKEQTNADNPYGINTSSSQLGYNP